MVIETKPEPIKLVTDRASFDRLELLCYDLHKVGVITEEVREEALFQLDTWFGYTRGTSDFPELDEFYLKVYYALPEGADNQWFSDITVDTDHFEIDGESEGDVLDSEYIFERGVKTAIEVLTKEGNIELASEVKNWYEQIIK